MGPSDSSVGFNSTKMNLPVSFQGTCGPVFVSDTHFVGYRCTLLSESASVSTAPSLQFKKDTFCLNNKKQDGNATRRFHRQKHGGFIHLLCIVYCSGPNAAETFYSQEKALHCLFSFWLRSLGAAGLFNSKPSRTLSSFISPRLLHFPIAPVMKNTKEPCGLWC